MKAAGAILATIRDGAAMPISEYGPVFVMFPFDDRPEIQNDAFYHRAVWHLYRIEIR
jgi:hypothetical protein